MKQRYEHRLIDWRFMVSLALLATIAWIIISGIEANQEVKQRDLQLRVRSGQITSLIAEVQADAAVAATERAKSLVNQKLLLDYTRALAVRQTALLAYLAKHGIKIPEQYLEPISIPSLNQNTTAPLLPNPPVVVKKKSSP